MHKWRIYKALLNGLPSFLHHWSITHMSLNKFKFELKGEEVLQFYMHVNLFTRLKSQTKIKKTIYGQVFTDYCLLFDWSLCGTEFDKKKFFEYILNSKTPHSIYHISYTRKDCNCLQNNFETKKSYTYTQSWNTKMCWLLIIMITYTKSKKKGKIYWNFFVIKLAILFWVSIKRWTLKMSGFFFVNVNTWNKYHQTKHYTSVGITKKFWRKIKKHFTFNKCPKSNNCHSLDKCLTPPALPLMTNSFITWTGSLWCPDFL